MSQLKYINVVQVKPAQHQVNLRVKVINQIMLAECKDDSSSGSTKIAEFLVGDQTGCIIIKAIDDQVNLIQNQQLSMIAIHNARVEMYRGFMRIVVDYNTRGEILPIISSLPNQEIHDKDNISNKFLHSTNPAIMNPNLENNLSLVEYQYVPIK
ncbi:hypothetical protein G9A89_009647 [Geosiphon pyriformis]|nr:hypothetical protein G9A89_009647 [Geosiphon pyriformis]